MPPAIELRVSPGCARRRTDSARRQAEPIAVKRFKGFPKRMAFGTCAAKCPRCKISQSRESRMRTGRCNVQGLIGDLAYGLRALARTPAFALASIATLMLCIGANTAIFTIVNAVLLRPLPYRDAERLVWISEQVPQVGGEVGIGPDYVAWRDSAKSFDRLAAYDSETFNATGVGDPVRVEAAEVTSSWFEVLDVQPRLGRAFSAQDDRVGADPVVVLTYAFWQSRFAGDAAAVGQPITLDGVAHTIVGVMPAAFRFPDDTAKPDLLRPLALTPFNGKDTSFRNVSILGRLAPGVSPGQAATELDGLNAQNHASFAGDAFFQGMQVRVQGLQAHLVGDVRTGLLVLMATVTFVLLIGCVNVANLQLARSTARRKEMAVRSALGANRARLVRQLLTESFLLACAGAAAGLLFGTGIVGLLRAMHIEALPQLHAVALDRNVYLFTALLVGATTVIFGLLPGLATTGAASPAAADASVRVTPAAGSRRLGNALIVCQLALALILLGGAGLLVRTFVGLVRSDPGFRSEGLITAKIALPADRYPDRRKQQAFFDELLRRLQALPGVTGAAAGSSLPLAGHGIRGGVRAEGQPDVPASQAPKVYFDSVSSDYFRTLGITLVEGRAFNASDAGAAAQHVIVNQAVATQFFPGQSAIGKHIKMALADEWAEIVGVVGSVRDGGLDQAASPQIYLPMGRFPAPTRIAMRTAASPDAYVDVLRREVLAVDPNQPVFDVATMKVQIADSLGMRWFNMVLLAAFALLALALSAVGIYGLIACDVAQRTQEIGIRLALGADRRRVLRLMVGTGVRLTAVGLLLGGAGFLALSRFMSSLVWGVPAADAATLLGGAAILAVVAVTAAYMPSRRAACVDPIVALRHE
jgi:putative ABC transport system permease protein